MIVTQRQRFRQPKEEQKIRERDRQWMHIEEIERRRMKDIKNAERAESEYMNGVRRKKGLPGKESVSHLISKPESDAGLNPKKETEAQEQSTYASVETTLNEHIIQNKSGDDREEKATLKSPEWKETKGYNPPYNRQITGIDTVLDRETDCASTAITKKVAETEKTINMVKDAETEQEQTVCREWIEEKIRRDDCQLAEGCTSCTVAIDEKVNQGLLTEIKQELKEDIHREEITSEEENTLALTDPTEERIEKFGYSCLKEVHVEHSPEAVISQDGPFLQTKDVEQKLDEPFNSALQQEELFKEPETVNDAIGRTVVHLRDVEEAAVGIEEVSQRYDLRVLEEETITNDLNKAEAKENSYQDCQNSERDENRERILSQEGNNIEHRDLSEEKEEVTVKNQNSSHQRSCEAIQASLWVNKGEEEMDTVQTLHEEAEEEGYKKVELVVKNDKGEEKSVSQSNQEMTEIREEEHANMLKEGYDEWEEKQLTREEEARNCKFAQRNEKELDEPTKPVRDEFKDTTELRHREENMEIIKDTNVKNATAKAEGSGWKAATILVEGEPKNYETTENQQLTERNEIEMEHEEMEIKSVENTSLAGDRQINDLSMTEANEEEIAIQSEIHQAEAAELDLKREFDVSGESEIVSDGDFKHADRASVAQVSSPFHDKSFFCHKRLTIYCPHRLRANPILL